MYRTNSITFSFWDVNRLDGLYLLEIQDSNYIIIEI